MNLLSAMVGRIICMADPWEILAQSNDVEGVNGLDIGGLIFTLRRAGIMICFLAIASAVIIMIATQGNPKKIQEQKSNIQHKLVVLWLIGSIIFIFNTMKAFFDAGFGL